MEYFDDLGEFHLPTYLLFFLLSVLFKPLSAEMTSGVIVEYVSEGHQRSHFTIHELGYSL